MGKKTNQGESIYATEGVEMVHREKLLGNQHMFIPSHHSVHLPRGSMPPLPTMCQHLPLQYPLQGQPETKSWPTSRPTVQWHQRILLEPCPPRPALRVPHPPAALGTPHCACLFIFPLYHCGQGLRGWQALAALSHILTPTTGQTLNHPVPTSSSVK